MPPTLVPDVIREIILHLTDSDLQTGEYNSDGLRNLYPCLFVNREWCKIAIPILWSQPFHFGPFQSVKIIEMYLKCLNEQEREALNRNGVNVDLLLQKEINIDLLFGEDEEEDEEEEEMEEVEEEEVDNNRASRGLMSLEFITNRYCQPQPLFPYPQYLRKLSYEAMFNSVETVCKYLNYMCDEDIGQQELNDQIKLIVNSLFRLSTRSGAKLNGLTFYPNSPENDVDKYQLLEDPEYYSLFRNVKSLDICCLFRKTELLAILGRVCHQVQHLHIHTIWSRHAGERHIDQTGEVIHSLFASQRSLVSFRLTSCKAYTRIFFPLLALHSSTLLHIKFDQVDFRGCGEWTSISDCNNLELLEIIQCTNLESDMVKPLIATNNETKLSRFGRGFEVRYIRISPCCEEFENWVEKINGNRSDDVELPFQLGEASGSNNRVGKRQ